MKRWLWRLTGAQQEISRLEGALVDAHKSLSATQGVVGKMYADLPSTKFDELARQHALLQVESTQARRDKEAALYGLQGKLALAESFLTVAGRCRYEAALDLNGMNGEPGPSIFEGRPQPNGSIILSAKGRK